MSWRRTRPAVSRPPLRRDSGSACEPLLQERIDAVKDNAVCESLPCRAGFGVDVGPRPGDPWQGAFEWRSLAGRVAHLLRRIRGRRRHRRSPGLSHDLRDALTRAQRATFALTLLAVVGFAGMLAL